MASGLPRSRHTEEAAIRNGVILVRLWPRPIVSPDVVAICYSSGCSVRNGSELWVREELKKMGISIIHDFTTTKKES